MDPRQPEVATHDPGTRLAEMQSRRDSRSEPASRTAAPSTSVAAAPRAAPPARSAIPSVVQPPRPTTNSASQRFDSRAPTASRPTSGALSEPRTRPANSRPTTQTPTPYADVATIPNDVTRDPIAQPSQPRTSAALAESKNSSKGRGQSLASTDTPYQLGRMNIDGRPVDGRTATPGTTTPGANSKSPARNPGQFSGALNDGRKPAVVAPSQPELPKQEQQQSETAKTYEEKLKELADGLRQDIDTDALNPDVGDRSLFRAAGKAANSVAGQMQEVVEETTLIVKTTSQGLDRGIGL